MGPKTIYFNLFGKFFCISFLIVFSNSVNSQQNIDLIEKVLALNEMVQDPSRQVGNFDPDNLPNLPIGLAKEINNKKYIIAIDSAYFLPEGAFFSAYMALELPGADRPLAFAAKNIQFNPEGVIGGDQVRLQLVSDHTINMGPNTKLHLPGDGSNYVKWNCNGFEMVNLHGAFLLSDAILQPTPASGDTAVTAEFEILVNDVHNMITSVDFSPFTIKGIDDLNFTVSEAYVDMSDLANPQNVNFPQCYHEMYPDDINLWRGFYVKNFSVNLPDEISRSDQETVIYANNMFIDDAGVTGFVGAENLFSANQGEMAGEWGFSVDLLEIELTTNTLTGGTLEGQVKVPALDDNALEYEATVFQNDLLNELDYQFVLSPKNNVSMSCFNSSLDIYSSSSINVSKQNGKFFPQLSLNGQWTLNNSNAVMQGIAFQSFTIFPEAPYVSSGCFSLISGNSNSNNQAGNFPISISNIAVGSMNNHPVFGADVGVNFGEDDDANNFSASTTILVHTSIEKISGTNKNTWQYDHFEMSDILLEINTNPFQLNGLISYNSNDPTYGKGFYGGLSVDIKDLFDYPLTMSCAFGRVNGIRYWMVDAAVPVNIAMSQVTITGITGGLAYHMLNTKSQQQFIDDAGSITAPPSNPPPLSMDYVPDGNIGLSFKAGVGFKHTVDEKVLNGDVLFTVVFNSNGGLQNIQFLGDAYMMVTRDERNSSSDYIHGSVAVNYDNQANIFDAQISAQAQFYEAINASVWSKIYISPDLWYIWVGRPSNPCTASVYNLATANAYFMLGQNLEPIPPPPPQVASVFNTMNDQRDEGSIASGDGVALGLNFDVSFSGEIGWDNFQIYGSGYAGAGFDMTLYKYASSTHCQGSSGEFGMNYWYLQGQLYAYLGLDTGISGTLLGKDFNVSLLSVNTALLLQGKLPKPSYVYGGVYLQATVLSVIDVSLTYDFDFGENCIIVNS